MILSFRNTVKQSIDLTKSSLGINQLGGQVSDDGAVRRRHRARISGRGLERNGPFVLFFQEAPDIEDGW